MNIKSLVLLSIVFVLGVVATVSAQLPFNMFGTDTVPPKEWKYFSYSVQGIREGDMLIADISDTTNTDIQLFAQFDRQPAPGDTWSFSYSQTINNGAFERIFALIDVVIGESRIVHLDEGQYQFFRYNIDEAIATDGNYLLRVETVAVNGDVISFRGRSQFPIGIPNIGFTYGIPALDEPGTSYVGLLSTLEQGIEYAGVANLYPPGDPEDESTNAVMSFSYAQSYSIPASSDYMFEQTYELLPNSWLYLTVPVGSANTVLVVETVTPGPLMLPLIRNGGFPSALYHDGWSQRTILRRLDSANTLQYIFKAVSEPVNRPNTVVGYLNTDTEEIYANVIAHYALVRDVRLGDSFENEFLNRSGMWRFYRFQSTETDQNAVLSISFTPSSGQSDVFYFIGGYPTTEQNLPWLTSRTEDGSNVRTLTVGLTLNTVYTVGVLVSDQLNPSTYTISFNRATRSDVGVPDAVNNTVSTALIIVVVILGCTTAIGIIAVIILAIQRKKEQAALASGEGPNYAKLVDTD